MTVFLVSFGGVSAALFLAAVVMVGFAVINFFRTTRWMVKGAKELRAQHDALPQPVDEAEAQQRAKEIAALAGDGFMTGLREQKLTLLLVLGAVVAFAVSFICVILSVFF
jgi:hypothetical protein